MAVAVAAAAVAVAVAAVQALYLGQCVVTASPGEEEAQVELEARVVSVAACLGGQPVAVQAQRQRGAVAAAWGDRWCGWFRRRWWG